MNFGVRAVCVLLLAAILGGCASRGATPPGAVAEAISREAAQAARPAARPAAKSDSAAIDRALLPDVPMLDGRDAGGKPKEARFDLVVQNAPATQVFNAIVTGTPFSMLIGPDVGGTITVSLKNVTLREALDTIRELYGYEYLAQGNRITIQSNAVQTRVFKVNYLQGRRYGRTDTRLTSTSIAGTTAGGVAGTTTTPAPASANVPAVGGPAGSTDTTASARIATFSDGDFWDEVRRALVAIAGGGDNVVINPSSGVIVVKATPAQMRNVEAYLKATQLMIERQVMLEAKIIEVQLNEGFQSGVNWAQFGGHNNRYAVGVNNPKSILQVAPAGSSPDNSFVRDASATVVPGQSTGLVTSLLGQGFYGLAFQSVNFAAMLNFLETQGTVHVLSSPRVATLNNQKAVLKVGKDEFFVTNVSTTTTTGTGATTTSPTVTLQPFFSGIAFDVTPQIDDNSQIILHVRPTVSLVEEKIKRIDLGSGGTLTLPLASSAINETDSVVRVQDGQIVAIGGLMHQRQISDRSQLPGASNLGALDWLFGQKSNSTTKSELVILIKPTVIRDEADWQASQRETLDRLQEYAPARPVVITN